MFEGNGLLPLIARLKAEFITRAERLYAGSFWGARTLTASTTATLSDVVFLANTAAGNITVTLPLASSATGKVYTLKKVSSDANTATFARAGSDTIDGVTSVALTGYMQSVMIVSDGTGWFVPANFSRYVIPTALAPAENVVIVNGRALYSPAYYEVPNGFSVDVRSGGILEVG